MIPADPYLGAVHMQGCVSARPPGPTVRPPGPAYAADAGIADLLAVAQQQYASMHGALCWHAADAARGTQAIDALIDTLLDIRQRIAP